MVMSKNHYIYDEFEYDQLLKCSAAFNNILAPAVTVYGNLVNIMSYLHAVASREAIPMIF